MKLSPVTSSNIEAYAHNPAKKVLQVKFKNGSLYEYHDVSEEVVKEWMAAPSVGSFFSKRIARGYKYYKVESVSCKGCTYLDVPLEEGCIGFCKKYQRSLSEEVRLEQCDEPFFPING
jgi:hypothetical protein